MWPHRAEIERELERALLQLPALDVLHLRFADVGTFAAARVCRRLGIPVCFTLAADPHVVIRAAEQAGRLSRETFGEAEVREHYLLRAHIVESMLEQAAGLVTFPRPDAAADLRDMLGIELAARRPEGCEPSRRGSRSGRSTGRPAQRRSRPSRRYGKTCGVPSPRFRLSAQGFRS